MHASALPRITRHGKRQTNDVLTLQVHCLRRDVERQRGPTARLGRRHDLARPYHARRLEREQLRIPRPHAHAVAGTP